MKYDILIKELQLKVEEVSEKYQKMKEKLAHSENHEENEELQSLIKELEMLNENIQDQYAQVKEKEKLNEKKMSEVEKNIYDGIRSFSGAYTSAVSIFQDN